MIYTLIQHSTYNISAMACVQMYENDTGVIKKKIEILSYFILCIWKVDHVLMFAWTAPWWSFHPVESPSITAPPPRLCGTVFIITTLSHHQSDWWPFLLREADAAYLWTHAGRACWQRRGRKKNTATLWKTYVYPGLFCSSQDEKQKRCTMESSGWP